MAPQENRQQDSVIEPLRGWMREVGPERCHLTKAFQPGVGDIIRVRQESTSRNKIHQQLPVIYPPFIWTLC